MVKQLKGITPVVSVILLLLVTIAVVGFATGFFQRIMSAAGASAEQQLNVSTTQLSQTIKLDSAAGTTVVVRSTGSKAIDLSSVTIFINNMPQTCTTWNPSVLTPGNTATCTMAASCAVGATIKATGPGGEAPEKIVCA